MPSAARHARTSRVGSAAAPSAAAEGEPGMRYSEKASRMSDSCAAVTWCVLARREGGGAVLPEGVGCAAGRLRLGGIGRVWGAWLEGALWEL